MSYKRIAFPKSWDYELGVTRPAIAREISGLAVITKRGSSPPSSSSSGMGPW